MVSQGGRPGAGGRLTATTPRQVLYGLVSAGFLAVTAFLTAGTAVAGIVPWWWSAALAGALGVFGLWLVFNWRRTAVALLVSIAFFLAWMLGTLFLSGS